MYADLSGAQLNHATLDSANLNEADLENTDLTGASLRFAYLCGAHLSKAVGLDVQQLNSAIGDSTTELPTSIDIRRIQWLSQSSQ
jgi:uncharacterized protein YjbI with pentapeptide repeats